MENTQLWYANDSLGSHKKLNCHDDCKNKSTTSNFKLQMRPLSVLLCLRMLSLMKGQTKCRGRERERERERKKVKVREEREKVNEREEREKERE